MPEIGCSRQGPNINSHATLAEPIYVYDEKPRAPEPVVGQIDPNVIVRQRYEYVQAANECLGVNGAYLRSQTLWREILQSRRFADGRRRKTNCVEVLPGAKGYVACPVPRPLLVYAPLIDPLGGPQGRRVIMWVHLSGRQYIKQRCVQRYMIIFQPQQKERPRGPANVYGIYILRYIRAIFSSLTCLLGLCAWYETTTTIYILMLHSSFFLLRLS